MGDNFLQDLAAVFRGTSPNFPDYDIPDDFVFEFDG